MYIWEKYRTFEITSGIILKMNLPLYKGFTLEITNKWWTLTTLNRWPLYRIKIYSKMHRENMKVTIMKRWPLYKGDRYDRFDCIFIWIKNQKVAGHGRNMSKMDLSKWGITSFNYLSWFSMIVFSNQSHPMIKFVSDLW